jgi:hypothetical protein
VRAEEKQVEGLTVEHEVGLEKLDETVEQQELPEVAGQELRDVERADGSTLLAAMRQILANSPLDIEQLVLPAREVRALDALQKAVTGKSDIHMFVFAEDRKSMLEQALAVLQPNLTASGQTSELAEMSDSLEQMTKRVAELRHRLTNLSDAQDELMADEKDRFVEAAAAETGDKPAKPSDPDAPRPASTVKGPGPEVEWKEKPITVDKGPEAKREEHASTLSKGTEVKREDKPTTLGDPKEIAAGPPWWQRKKPDVDGK